MHQAQRRRTGAAAMLSAVALIATSAPALAAGMSPGAGSLPMRMVDPVVADSIFISEFHYDNVGADVGEFIEVQAPVGTDLTDWQIVLYNGSNNAVYDTKTLAGTVPAAGVVVQDYPTDGIQNGSPDGIALVTPDGTVVEFLSYEGPMTAVGGPAAGIASTDVGVSETNATPIGQSLQRIDGVWTGPLENTKGELNGPGGGGGDPDPGETIEVTLGEVNAGWVGFLGKSVTTRGVVTADYSTGGFNGYTIQTEGSGGDTDLTARTASDGLFMYSPTTMNEVQIGDFVEVTGVVAEYNGLRQLTVAAGKATVLEEEFLPVVPVDNFILPGDENRRLVFQNMLVVPTGYYVSDTYQLGGWGSQGGFGSLVLGHQGPLIQESDVAKVGTPEFDAIVADNAARAVTLDDGRSPRLLPTDEVPYLTGNHDIRTGVKLDFGEPVVVDYRFQWNFQPTTPVTGQAPWLTVAGGETRAANAAPRDVGGDFQIATFNVLNYFTTLGDSVAGCTSYDDRDGNPLTVRGGCNPRGAWDDASFQRQQGKIVEAINGLEAEVVVLQEIENTAATLSDSTRESRDDSLKQLVAALNADAGAGTWDYVPSPAPADQPALADQDVIRPAFIFQPSALEMKEESSSILVGSPAFDNAREPEAIAFSSVATPDYEFAVVASHFKSKGGSCGTPAPVEGCFNGDRVNQAKAMADFADAYALGLGIDDVFLAGDFNSYTMEDPMLAFATAGYDVISNGETSYVFDGKIGSLDHVLANDSAKARVTGSDIWAINAEESVLNEYSRYNYTVSDLFQGDNPFRASDHNPAIVGLMAGETVEAGYTGVVDVLSINDLHGRLVPDRGQGGAVALACTVEDYRADNPGNVIFGAAGDLVGASTFLSAVQDDAPTMNALNAIGLQVSALGNHEFDKGRTDLDDRIIPASDYTYLAANVRNTDGTHAYPTHEIIETDAGIKVAFIGGITEELHSLVSPTGIETLEITDLATEVSAVVNELKTADAADVYIVVVHDGSETVDLSSVSGTSYGDLLDAVEGDVAAVISGHTHKQYVVNVGGTWATMTGEYGANLGHLTLNFEDGELVSTDAENVSLGGSDDPITCDNAVADEVSQIIADAQAVADELGSVKVGEITADFNRAAQSDGSENRGGESTIGNFLADVHLWAGEQAGAQIAFMNPGGIRADLTYAHNPQTLGDGEGIVTYAEAAVIQPFANTLMTRTLTGAQVVKVLEQQWQPADASRSFLKLGVSKGLDYLYDPEAPEGQRIVSVTFNGEPLDLEGEYVVIGNSFLMGGGDNFTALAEGTAATDTGRVDLSATVDWFEANEVASPDYVQRGIGVTWISDPAATLAAGDQVALDTSSWSFSTTEPLAENLVVTFGGVDVGTFVLDNSIVDNTDEAGRASVSFTVPMVTATDGTAMLVIADPVNGSEISIPMSVKTKTGPGKGGNGNGQGNGKGNNGNGNGNGGNGNSHGDGPGNNGNGNGQGNGKGNNGNGNGNGGSNRANPV